jgi:hypothetical protein
LFKIFIRPRRLFPLLDDTLFVSVPARAVVDATFLNIAMFSGPGISGLRQRVIPLSLIYHLLFSFLR